MLGDPFAGRLHIEDAVEIRVERGADIVGEHVQATAVADESCRHSCVAVQDITRRIAVARADARIDGPREARTIDAMRRIGKSDHRV